MAAAGTGSGEADRVGARARIGLRGILGGAGGTIAEVPGIAGNRARGSAGEPGRQGRGAGSGRCAETGYRRCGGDRNGPACRVATVGVADGQAGGVSARRAVGFHRALGGAGGAVAEVPGPAGDGAGRGVGEGDGRRGRAAGRTGSETGGRSGSGTAGRPADLVGKAALIRRAGAIVSPDREIIHPAIGQIGYRGGGCIAGIHVGGVVAAANPVVDAIARHRTGTGIPGQGHLPGLGRGQRDEKKYRQQGHRIHGFSPVERFYSISKH